MHLFPPSFFPNLFLNSRTTAKASLIELKTAGHRLSSTSQQTDRREKSDSVAHPPNLSLPDFPLNYAQSSQKPERLLPLFPLTHGSPKQWSGVMATELLILPLVNQVFAYQEIIRDDLNF